MSSVWAQNTPNTLLNPSETQSTASRVVQLMDLTSTALPGLSRASEGLRQTTQATAAALGKSPRDASLTLQFVNEIRAYLALADAMPRVDFFPPTLSQQLSELRDDSQRFDRHFAALLVREQEDARAAAADPYNLQKYAVANSRELTPTPSLPRYVFLGDGATEGWRLGEFFSGQDFVNRGIEGQTSSQILARFLADVVALHPLAVVILAGSGDIGAGLPPSAIADNLVMMGDVAKAHSLQPIFASVLPARGEAAKVRTPDAIRKVNTWLRDYCIRENFIYLDYYSAMADGSGMMKADLSDDGVNPNQRGYKVMAPLVGDAIQRLREMLAAPEDPTKPRRRLLPSLTK